MISGRDMQWRHKIGVTDDQWIHSKCICATNDQWIHKIGVTDDQWIHKIGVTDVFIAWLIQQLFDFIA
jgi:hypothetical protein